MFNALDIVIDMLESRLGSRVTRQVICVLLLLFGVSRRDIEEKIGTSPATLCKYNKLICNNEVQKLFEAELYRPVSELEKFAEQIEKDFEEKPPKTRREAQERIKKLTGIERSLPRVGAFLKKRG